jgi:hypothetical protein
MFASTISFHYLLQKYMSKMTKGAKATKDVDMDCMLKIGTTPEMVYEFACFQ